MDIVLGFVDPGDVGESGLDLILAEQTGLGLAETHGTGTPATHAALHLAHEKHEDRHDQQDREGSEEQLLPEAGLVGLAALDIDIVVEQIAHQATVVDIRPNGAEAGAAVALALDFQPVDDHAAHGAILHFIDEIGVGDGLGHRTTLEILENRQQYRSDDQPQDEVFRHFAH